MKKRSALEDALEFQIQHLGLPKPEREYRFCARKWRFDFAWPDRRIAIEVDGGLFVFGGHSRGAQQLKDMEKRNEALCLGWRVLRVGGPHVHSGQAVEWLERLLAS